MVGSPRLPNTKRPRSPESQALKAATLDQRRRKAHKSKHNTDLVRSVSVRKDRQRAAPTKKIPKFQNDHSATVSESDKDDSAEFSDEEEVEEVRSTQPTQPRKNKLTGNDILGEDPENIDSSDGSEKDDRIGDTTFNADPSEESRFKNTRSRFEDSDDEDGFLSEALQAQRQYAKDKNIIRVTPGKKYSQDATDDSVSEHDVTSFEDRWMLELSKYPEDFFDTEEARMTKPAGISNTATGRQRKKPYKGVAVDIQNNKDIAFVCQNLYTEKSETYENFKTCIGQLARLAIATNLVDKDDLWDCGEFFQVCSIRMLFQLFIGHYQNESTGGTVMNKATHLRNFVDQAMNYFSIAKPTDFSQKAQQKRSRTMAKMRVVYQYLQKTAAKGKRDARLDRAARKELEHKKKAGRALTEDDVIEFRQLVVERLGGILQTFKERCRERRAREFHSKFEVVEDLLKSKTLMQKWGINMTMLLVWFGQGQRNQVYCSMEAPSVNDLELFKTTKGGTKAKEPLEIGILRREKTQRSNTLPNIILDPIILPFLIFHVKFVLRFLHKKHNIPAGDKRTKLLLIHTESGKMLKEKNILRSLKRWVKEIDDELHITVMDVRAAYASYMIQKYVRDADNGGDAFKHLEKDAFLQIIADIMNTSKEQLNNVYMASVKEGFNKTVAGLIGIVNKDEGQAGNEPPRSDLFDIVERIDEDDF